MWWESRQSKVLVNQRAPPEWLEEASRLLLCFSELHSHVWIATSGSSGKSKWVALSQEAILLSAQSVNDHLSSSSTDIWFHSLPEWHVGGLAIWARAFLSKAAVVKDRGEKWNPDSFCQQIEESKATLTSLVPTQVYDLVERQMRAPSSLRAVVVGGGMLSDAYYAAGVKLGWPILPSYGLTECASQVATAELGSDLLQERRLKVLPHVAIRHEPDFPIALKSRALLTGYAVMQEGHFAFIDPKKEGWFQTEDLADFRFPYLYPLGRQDNLIKIGGEKVSIERLEGILDLLKVKYRPPGDLALIAVPDERLSYVMHLLATQESIKLKKVVAEFNSSVFPYERIREQRMCLQLPRTALGKRLQKTTRE